MARVSKLFGVSHGLREHLARSHDQAAGDAFLKASKYIDELDRKLYPVPEVAKGSKAHKQAHITAQPLDPEAIQLRIKLHHASAYFKSLHQALSDGLVTAPVSVSRLVESTLLGSASERLAGTRSPTPSALHDSLTFCRAHQSVRTQHVRGVPAGLPALLLRVRGGDCAVHPADPAAHSPHTKTASASDTQEVLEAHQQAEQGVSAGSPGAKQQVPLHLHLVRY